MRSNPDQIPLDFMMPESDWCPPSELPDLRQHGTVALDLETKDDGLSAGRGPGWAHGAGYICGVAMAAGDRRVYAPTRHPGTENFDEDAVRRWAEDHTRSCEMVYQNAPYDLGWLQAQWGIAPPERLHDTMAMAYILDEQLPSMSLDSLCAWQGLPGKDESLLEEAAAAMGCDPKKDLWRMPARYVGPYGEQDAQSTLRLWERLRSRIIAEGLLEPYQLEVDLIPLVLEMRRRGVRIDMVRAEETKSMFAQQHQECLDELGRRTNWGRPLTQEEINSPRTLARIFDREGVPYPNTMPTDSYPEGQPSFQKTWMERVDHWLPKLVARANALHNAGDKFIGNYIMDFAHLGRIHPEIHQYRTDRGGTRTSRMSYSNPPLQQMPSRDPMIATAIRSLFLPEDGEIWGAPDYSQQEFRLIVHFASVCGMLGVDEAVEMYRSDPRTDFHDVAAELTGLPRRKAKDVNFAKAFGAGKKKFAEMTGMLIDEAAATMDEYDRKLPFVSRLSDFCQKRANRRGYLRLIDGARTRFDLWEPRWVDWGKQKAHMEAVGWDDMPTNACRLEEAQDRTKDERHFWYRMRIQRAFTHKAMNSLIQGSAARQTKLAMRECWREGIVPLLQMHDELSGSFSDEATANRMAEIMRDVVQLEVPVVVDLEYGVNWGEAKAKDGYGATWKEACDARDASKRAQ